MPDIESIDINPILNNTDIPRLYANGFMVSAGASDFILIMQSNGLPIQILNMSYTSAKSLASILNQTVQAFELKTKIEIHSIEDIKKRYSENE